MSIKKLYTNIRLPFTDPYVVCLEYPTINADVMDIKEYRKVLKLTRENISNSWAYSSPQINRISIAEEESSVVSRQPWVFTPQYTLCVRSYWAFSNILDALQFRLLAGETAKQVYMWPQRTLFTVFRIEEMDTS